MDWGLWMVRVTKRVGSCPDGLLTLVQHVAGLVWEVPQRNLYFCSFSSCGWFGLVVLLAVAEKDWREWWETTEWHERHERIPFDHVFLLLERPNHTLEPPHLQSWKRATK